MGYEVAGVVEAVGEGVDSAWIGKKVATIPAIRKTATARSGKKPSFPPKCWASILRTSPPTQASAIWMQYLTAYGALVYFGGVKPGDFVSIPAASSSVGIAAIQITRDAGATAIAVTPHRGQESAVA